MVIVSLAANAPAGKNNRHIATVRSNSSGFFDLVSIKYRGRRFREHPRLEGEGARAAPPTLLSGIQFLLRDSVSADG